MDIEAPCVADLLALGQILICAPCRTPGCVHALSFACPQVLEDELVLLEDGSREVCHQPCMQGTEFGVGGVEATHCFVGLFSHGGN